MSEAKEPIGCRVPKAWISKVDELADTLGVSRSQWLYDLIDRELNGTNVNGVHSIPERVTALEKKLKALALN